MTVAYTQITGSTFLAGLLGQGLYSQLLDPPQSTKSDASATGSQTLTAAEALDEVFLTPQAQALLQQASEATLNYSGHVNGAIVFDQVTPEQDARRIAGQTTQASDIEAGIDLTDPDPSLANRQTQAGLGVNNIEWGRDAAGDETFSSQSLDIDRDTTGAVEIRLRYDNSVEQGSTYGDSATTYLIKIAPSGSVNFDVTDSQGGISYDSAGDRSLGWASTELNLNDTPTGTVVTLTQDDGSAYDARNGSVDISSDTRVVTILDDASANTGSNAAVQLLATSIQRFSEQNTPQLTSNSGYHSPSNAAFGPSSVAAPQASAPAVIKTLVLA